MAVGCDWLPTIAALTGSKLPSRKLDGKSHVDVIDSAQANSPYESHYWQIGEGKNAQWAVRQGNWKLLGNPQDPRDPNSIGPADKFFLANLEKDPTESKNLAAEHREVVRKLKSLQPQFAESIKSDASAKIGAAQKTR